MAPPNPQAINYCFTSFNEAEPYFDNVIFRYLIYQPEETPSTNRPHWQGFFTLVAQTRATKLMKVFHGTAYEGAHLTVCLGDAESNFRYCSKVRTSVGEHKEFGIFQPGQGNRVDLSVYLTKIKDGKHPNQVIAENPQSVRYCKWMDRYHMCCKNKGLREINVSYVWGPAGIGKSKMVWEIIKDRSYYIPSVEGAGTRMWFDGYAGESIIWLDDFDYRMSDLNQLLKVLDRYPYRAPIKGSTTMAEWTEVYITSNIPPPVLESLRRRMIITDLTPQDEGGPSPRRHEPYKGRL